MRKKSPYNFFQSSPVSLKMGALICMSVYGLLLLIFISGGEDYVYGRIVHPLVFQIRNLTSFANPLDPRIRIYAIDQKTMNTIDHETLQLKDWTALIKSISKSKPAAVFIDKAFFLTLSTDQGELREFKKALATLPKVIAAAWVFPAQIQGLSELQNPQLLHLSSDWPPISQEFIYGPRSEIVDAFTHIGHTNYEDYGYIKPIIRTTKTTGIPYWSLAAGSVTVSENRIEVDGNEVPTDAHGRILVNLSSPAQYGKNIFSLINVLKKARAGEALEEINSQTVVVILTGMYAGTTAMKNTPAGKMPGGFINTEVINSVLTNTWIRSTGYELFFSGNFLRLRSNLRDFSKHEKFLVHFGIF